MRRSEGLPGGRWRTDHSLPDVKVNAGLLLDKLDNGHLGLRDHLRPNISQKKLFRPPSRPRQQERGGRTCSFIATPSPCSFLARALSPITGALSPDPSTTTWLHPRHPPGQETGQSGEVSTAHIAVTGREVEARCVRTKHFHLRRR